MKRYIQAFDIEYFYWIYPDKTKESYALDKGRASSLMECQNILKYYQKNHSSSCVITVKELGRERWVCTRASSVF